MYSRPRISTPRRKPKNGELTIGRKTFHSRPLLVDQSPSPALDQISAPQLLCAADNAAPHRPPMSACEDDDGRPRHQVMRFQPIAPSNAQISTCALTCTTSVSTRPEEMVLATAVPMKAPIRFMPRQDHRLARRQTLVATTVAIELAVSWKPLMNSKTSANSTTSSTRVSIGAASRQLFLSAIE
jgi:hypothetical protein